MPDQLLQEDPPGLRVLSSVPLRDNLCQDGRGSPLVSCVTTPAAQDQMARVQPNALLLGKGADWDPVEAQFAARRNGSWSRVIRTDRDPAQPGSDPGALLREIERDFASSVGFARDKALIRDYGYGNKGKSVCLVGGGVVGLMTALALSEHGFAVSVLEASPAPQESGWQSYGCTHGGEDARMYSVTEYDNYNEKRDQLYADMGRVFEMPLSQGGWLAMDPARRSPDELLWNDMFRRVPVWLAQGYSAEIFRICAQARVAWKDLFARYPDLRRYSGLREGVVRTYDDPIKLEAARALQSELGALERALTPTELARHYPLFEVGVGNGAICGGLEVAGFTVQIHAFMRQLIALLIARGVRIEWGRRAVRLRRGTDDAIIGVETGDGVRTADHYVLSPGAYGGSLAEGFAGGKLMHGVIGAWLVLPHVGGDLARSAKLKRTAELNEDVNVTVGAKADGTRTITLGSGYGYLGENPDNLDPVQLELMYQQLDVIAQRYFPEAFAAARQAGWLSAKKYCVRPWTPTGQGVFECQRAQSGLALLIGGHNTGGFAVAPIVAQSVVAALQGETMDMHWQFQPRRLAAAVPALHYLLA